MDDFTGGLLYGRARSATAALGQANANVSIANDRIHSLEMEIIRLRRDLSIAKAKYHGRDAQMKDFAKMYSNSELLASSGKFFKDGTPKSKSRIVFENEFDAKAISFGIVNPSAYRTE